MIPQILAHTSLAYTSPNFDDRPLGACAHFIILHATVITPVSDVLTHLCAPETQVSAHYVLDPRGTLFQLVPPQKRAWHAGASFWKGEARLNDRSLGIELVNDMESPYPEAQITALIALLNALTAEHSIPRQNILGHQDIAPARKKDPGPHFPWDRLGKEGFGLWPAPVPEPNETRSAFLSRIGYGPTDKVPLAVLEAAFQDHFGNPGNR